MRPAVRACQLPSSARPIDQKSQSVSVDGCQTTPEASVPGEGFKSGGTGTDANSSP